MCWAPSSRSPSWRCCSRWPDGRARDSDLPAAPRRGAGRRDAALHRPPRRAALAGGRAPVRGAGRAAPRGPSRRALLERPGARAPQRRDHRPPARPGADDRARPARDGHGALGRPDRRRDAGARARCLRRVDVAHRRVPVSRGRERARPAGAGGARLRRHRRGARRRGGRHRRPRWAQPRAALPRARDAAEPPAGARAGLRRAERAGRERRGVGAAPAQRNRDAIIRPRLSTTMCRPSSSSVRERKEPLMRHTRRVPAVLAAMLLSLGLAAPLAAQEQPRMGGVFRAAMIGEPPTLDLHTTTAVPVQHITWHVYETPYTHDKNYNAVPLLVESHTVTDKGRTYTFKLRRGVKFHNGKEMPSADVVASLNRWSRLATPGKQLWKNVEAVEAKDPYTVVMYLKDTSGALLMGLARPNNGAVVYPKEIVDAAGDNQVKEVIGTGPYRFVEHKPDRHVKLVRFKDYAARSDAADGFGGKRTAYLDEILFIPVPDVAVRLAGIETGEYHYSQQLQQDQYDRIKTLPGVVPIIVKPSNWSTAVLNHK